MHKLVLMTRVFAVQRRSYLGFTLKKKKKKKKKKKYYTYSCHILPKKAFLLLINDIMYRVFFFRKSAGSRKIIHIAVIFFPNKAFLVLKNGIMYRDLLF